jgi:hypothetical protein
MVAFTYPSLTLYPQHAESQSEELVIDARRLDHSLAARREPRARFTVHHWDCDSATATSDLPLLFGEHVMLRFPASARRPAWNAFGRVVACDPDADGYRVKIDFDPLPAA